MDRILPIDDFKRFNGFYHKPECRPAVFNLYKGVCQFCKDPVATSNFHVAHVIARTHPQLMDEYLPGLDVDNLLNLKLSCPPCNLELSNFVLDAPLVLMKAFTLSAKAVAQRWHKVEELLGKKQALANITGTDPRICTKVLHLDLEAIDAISSDWQGAVVISIDKLGDHIRQELTHIFDREPDEADVRATLEEAIGYFKTRAQVAGTSMEAQSTKPHAAWWIEAWNQYERRVDARRLGVDKTGIEDVTYLPDGIYLDPAEIAERHGLWIPLRTETQRWFFEVFAELVRRRHMLESNVEHRRYIVLEDWMWQAICDCYQRLGDVSSGLGIVKHRLKLPEVVVHFAVNDGELCLHEADQGLPEEIKRLCRMSGETKGWSEGTVVLRARLKSWLDRAFALADLGVQRALGQDLVQIGGDQMRWRWVPPLPHEKGKTRDQVRQEAEQNASRRGRKGRGKDRNAVLWTPKIG